MRPERERVLVEGLIAGAVGYVAVGLFYAVVNLVAGRSLFHTAALLGGALFYGLEDAAAVVIAPGPILAYNGVHLLTFLVLGTLAALVVLEMEKHPALLYLIFFLVIAFLIFSYGMLMVFAASLALTLPWWSILGANLAAGMAMGAYLWRAHPRLSTEFRALSDPEAMQDPGGP